MVQLSDEQRAALDARPEHPLRLVDPVTQTPYVLLSEELFRRFRALFEEDAFQVSESYPLADEVARNEGWDDPGMDRYNALDPRRDR